MRTRYVALLALAALAAGGPMLVLGLPASVGLLARAGVLLLWLGTVAALASVLQVQRVNHRMLRSQATRIRAVRKAVANVPRTPTTAATTGLDERLAEEREALLTAVTESHRDVIRTVDARVLGLWEDLHSRQRVEGA